MPFHQLTQWELASHDIRTTLPQVAQHLGECEARVVEQALETRRCRAHVESSELIDRICEIAERQPHVVSCRDAARPGRHPFRNGRKRIASQNAHIREIEKL